MVKDNSKWLTLVGLGCIVLVLNLDITIVNLALPAIGVYFKAPLSELQWINNVYLLAASSGFLIAGKIADIYGQKKLFCIGAWILLIGFWMAMSAQSTLVLILGRIVQGFGMAINFPLSFVLINRMFKLHHRSLVTGILVIFTGIGQALGPTIGGILVHLLGWRSAFGVNIPFSFLGFCLVYLCCQPDKLIADSKNRDYLSAFLLAIFFVCSLILANQLEEWQFDVKLLFSFLIPIIISGVAFLCRQFVASAPLVGPKLLTNRNFIVISTVRCLFQFSATAIYFILPLYFQNILGFSAMKSGLIILIGTFIIIIVSPLSGYLERHVVPGKIIILSTLLGSIGILLLLFNSEHLNWFPLTIGLLLFGMNVGSMYAVSNYLMNNLIDRSSRGVGFSFFVSNAFFASGLGVAICGVMLASLSKAQFHRLLQAKNIHFMYPINHFSSILSGAQSINQLSHGLPKRSIQQVLPLVINAFVYAFHGVIMLLASLSFFSFLLSFYLWHVRVRK